MNDVQQLRHDLHLTQKAFAEEFFLNVRTLQQWEQGIAKPPTFLIPLIKRVVELEKRVGEANV